MGYNGTPIFKEITIKLTRLDALAFLSERRSFYEAYAERTLNESDALVAKNGSRLSHEVNRNFPPKEENDL